PEFARFVPRFIRAAFIPTRAGPTRAASGPTASFAVIARIRTGATTSVARVARAATFVVAARGAPIVVVSLLYGGDVASSVGLHCQFHDRFGASLNGRWLPIVSP